MAKKTEQLEDLAGQSKILLEKKQNIKNISLGNGIYYHSRPVEGELAFVFTGPAGAYPRMGRDRSFMNASKQIGSQTIPLQPRDLCFLKLLNWGIVNPTS